MDKDIICTNFVKVVVVVSFLNCVIFCDFLF